MFGNFIYALSVKFVSKCNDYNDMYTFRCLSKIWMVLVFQFTYLTRIFLSKRKQVSFSIGVNRFKTDFHYISCHKAQWTLRTADLTWHYQIPSDVNHCTMALDYWINLGWTSSSQGTFQTMPKILPKRILKGFIH